MSKIIQFQAEAERLKPGYIKFAKKKPKTLRAKIRIIRKVALRHSDMDKSYRGSYTPIRERDSMFNAMGSFPDSGWLIMDDYIPNPFKDM